MNIRNRTSLYIAAVVGILVAVAGTFYAADQKSGAENVAEVTVCEKSADLVVPIGATALFRAPNKEKEGHKHQWFKNLKPITGATNSSYSIKGVQKKDVGFYAVLVTDGSVYPEDAFSCTVTLFTYTTNDKGGIEATAPYYGPASFSTMLNPGVITNSTGPLNPTGGTKGNCPSNYAGYVKFKCPTPLPNGSYWWPRPVTPANTQCTITDQSSYTTKVEAVESGTLMSWCNTETVTFPTQAAPRKYQFTTYFTTINPPYLGDPITLLINWF
jgi:hypothetical protein